MRLLNTRSLELSRPYLTRNVPDYAILSHRWNAEEVTFEDINKAPISELQSQTRTRNGFAKIQGACELADRDGYAWIWIDSCCIDKSSSAELQEAINSMWRYYAESNVCYVYMEDVADSEAGWGEMFAKSEWFTRGWTLQELIAPINVEFYTKNWGPIGTKFERYKQIAEMTSINPDVLVRNQPIHRFNTAERLSWASHRKVTREEDETYSLLGLFDVNMPLLYGEGREKAFIRLQENIYNSSADHSIFLFRHSLHKDAQPLLADSPTRFCDRVECAPCLSRGIQCLPSNIRYYDLVGSARWDTQAHEQIMTNVTIYSNEMSTVLPLLDFRDVSSKLSYFGNGKPRVLVTHVAVLNHTLAKYWQGAFCLLVQRGSELDAANRLAFPAILPYLGDLVSQLQNTKLLFCPSPSHAETDGLTVTVFSVKSDLFRVDTWDAKGSISHSILAAPEIHDVGFEIETKRSMRPKVWIHLSCHPTSFRDPTAKITIQLIRMNGIWSIKEVFVRAPGSRKRDNSTQIGFRSSVLADRCLVQLPGGENLSVKLRRLPGVARGLGEDGVSWTRHQISVAPIEQ